MAIIFILVINFDVKSLEMFLRVDRKQAMIRTPSTEEDEYDT